jgi:RimJ/RimL family protein N-acetyltransferase
MQTTIRLANPDADFQRIAELLSLDAVEPMTETILHEEEAFILPGKIRRRWVAASPQQEILGYGMVVKYPSEPADLFHIHVIVDPSARRQGIGSELYESVLNFAHENGAGRIMAEVRENDPTSRRFAEQRGFSVDHHVFDSVLALAAFDETPFAGLIEKVEASGIRFFTLADTSDRAEAERKLYEVNRKAVLDEPSSTGTFPTYENWRKIVLEGSWYRAASQFIAGDGERYIGLAGVYNEQESPEAMFNGLTGVERDYRGRGIAMALKLLTIRYAKEHGAKTISTGNDARNAPMLAINRKLGYQPLVGHYGMLKRVE